MSFTNSAFASTSTDLAVGCGKLATAVLASRLGENAAATARPSGVPARAVYSVLRAIICTRLWTRRNSITCGAVIKPPKTEASPMPVASLGERKKGLLKSSGFSSIQTFSSFWYSVNRPSVFFASLMTVANGGGLPGGATAGCGVPGGTPEALGPALLAARGPFGAAAAEVPEPALSAAPLPPLPPPAPSDAQPLISANSTSAGTGRAKTDTSEFMEGCQDIKKRRHGSNPVPPCSEASAGDQFNNSAKAAAMPAGNLSLRGADESPHHFNAL